MSKSRIKMRLRYVTEVSFIRSEQTNFDLVPSHVRSKLKDNDTVCLISKGRDQMVFVYASNGEILNSVRLRLAKKRPWNPLMLADYATSVGIELVGIKKFKDHMKHVTDR